jgi:hypothetical protein
LENNDKLEEGNDAHIQALSELAILVEEKTRIAQRAKAETQRRKGRKKNEKKIEIVRRQIIEESLEEVLIPVPRGIYDEEAEIKLTIARNGIFDYLRKWASSSASKNPVESRLVEIWARYHEKEGRLENLLNPETAAGVHLTSTQPKVNPNNPAPIDDFLTISKPAIIFWLRHHELKLSCYHLRNVSTLGKDFLQTWNIDGSADGGKK